MYGICTYRNNNHTQYHSPRPRPPRRPRPRQTSDPGPPCGAPDPSGS